MYRKQLSISNLYVLCLLALFLFIRPESCHAAPETVRLPVVMDYPFLQSLIINQYYTFDGEKAVPVSYDGGCTQVELREPRISSRGSLIKFENTVNITLGAAMLGSCTKLLEWAGYVEVFQKVILDAKAFRIYFQTVEVHVYDLDHAETSLTSSLQNLIEVNVLPFLNKNIVDLTIPLNELKGVLPSFFTADNRTNIENWLKTIRPGELYIDQDAVHLDFLMDFEPVNQGKKEVKEATSEEIDNFASAWEAWDVYLVQLIQSLSGQPLTEDEKADLLEIILDTRYGFLDAISEKNFDRDLVSEQFVSSWQRVSQVLKKHLVQQISKSPLYYLAFISSSDALAVLHKLGPSIGLDISRVGLIRLVRLISQGKLEPLPQYSYAVNPELRTLLGFGPPLDETGPAFPEKELDIPEKDKMSFWPAFYISSAYATEIPPDKLESIMPWVPHDESMKTYLERVKQVMERAVDSTLSKKRHDEKNLPYFRSLCLATAWQESCWRQFVRTNGKIRYILSYNNTSVGLMQVNERVWRGVYKPENLRWNINYNANAGIEILEQYLQKYALKKTDPGNPMDHDTICRATYAMYNGGPGQFQKFMERHKSGKYYKSDNLFWDKYLLVKEGKFDKVSESNFP